MTPKPQSPENQNDAAHGTTEEANGAVQKSEKNGTKGDGGEAKANGHEEAKKEEVEVNGSNKEESERSVEEVAVEVEPKTGVSFPVKSEDGKTLTCVGMRKKSMLGLGIKIYGFGTTLCSQLTILLNTKVDLFLLRNS